MRLTRSVSCQLDALTFAAIVAASLDTWTTYYFIAHRLGIEKNANLALLAEHSLLWIPIVILSPPLLIPILPEVCRQSFAAFYLTLGLLFGLNNLAGIYAGRYILVDVFSFESVVISALFAGAAMLVYQLATNPIQRSLARSAAILAAWIAVFVSLDFVFHAIARFIT
jgi:hypothetical protein